VPLCGLAAKRVVPQRQARRQQEPLVRMVCSGSRQGPAKQRRRVWQVS
jgi:hypothetical protein